MLEKTLEKFVAYAERHLGLRPEDRLYYRNLLLHEFGLLEPYAGSLDPSEIPDEPLPDALLEELYRDLASLGLDSAEAERKGDYVLGLLSPSPSEVARSFKGIEESQGGEEALHWLLELGTANHYFQKTKVARNLRWDAHYDDGPSLIVTINLSKPEKNNKDIAKLLSKKAGGYPKCALCPENLGYYGDDKHAARTNLRFVPLTLNGEAWHLQFSPYGYFENHLIAFEDAHVPMHIDGKTFARLFDFVDRFPAFFLGSNSDLPIVGGSILDHEHFQGGSPVLPLFFVKKKEEVLRTAKGTSLSTLDFYDTALLVEGTDRKDAEEVASRVLSAWRLYSDPSLSIESSSENIHNTVTPYARKAGDTYRLYMILRNNGVSAAYPDGIFHAHPEYHMIKKEGIGLIEAAGLFVLPARLKRELGEVEDVVSRDLGHEEALRLYPGIAPFFPMIETLKKEGISGHEYVNRVCQGILRNVAVYKDDAAGQAGLARFLKEVK